MLCPKGHESEDNDFCSVCGVKIAASPKGEAAANEEAPPSKCPDCGSGRHPADTLFCEDCGYNYATGAHGEPKASAPDAEAPAPVLTEWEIAVSIDPALKTPESPEPPAGFQPSTMMLMGESYLIGRRSDKRGIFPQISLDADDAVSHRHALLNRTPEGGIVLRDVGSSNGTQVNGKPVEPLTDLALNDGDSITVGHWTRIGLRRVS